MLKSEVHTASTPLHLGFSCYVFDAAGRLLLTRRAASKRSFGGLWTNSVCGHPAPGEAYEDAARRRADHELDLVLADVRVVLPDYRYRAEHQGLVENEVCPVMVATTDGVPTLHPAEVDDLRWVAWRQFREWADREPAAFSPWCREQSGLLQEFGAVG